MNRTRVALLGVLAILAAAWGYQRLHDAQEAARSAESRARVAAEVSTAIAAQLRTEHNRAFGSGERPADDRQMIYAVPAAYARPTSDWLTHEKAFYEKILATRQFDVLVTPFQVQDFAVDRGTRSLMTAELAAALARTPQTRVPDPYFVAKALGDGQRRLLEDDIYRIANSTGVKRVVWGYVGHNRAGKMTFTMRVQERPNAVDGATGWTTPITTKKFFDVAFDDEHPPVEAYESLLPEIVKALGFDPATTVTDTVDSKLDIERLPDAPLKLMTDEGNPARDAYTFLLLGSLTPAHIESTKERFAEKALLALRRLSQESPEYAVLRARAYMMLGFRPAAIRTLGTATTEEAQELLAVLNGNLPQARARASQEKNGLKRLLEALDVNAIGVAYQVVETPQSLQEVKALRLPGKIWPYLATRAFVDADVWSQFDNGELKMLLDLELPVTGYSLKEIAGGAITAGSVAAIRPVLDLSVFNHGRKYIEAHADHWCCESAPDRPGEADYLELLTVAGHDNLMRHLNLLSEVQKLPREALDFANSIQSVYAGYPYYALERGKVERRLAGSSGGAEQEGLTKAAFDDEYNAMYWEQGQSYVSTSAMAQVSYMGPVAYGYFDNFYVADIPYHPLYEIWANGGDVATLRANGLAALKNATSQFATVMDLIGDQSRVSPEEKFVTEVTRLIQGRFMGSPERGDLLSKLAIQNGNTREASALLRENIALSPDYEPTYFTLGELLVKSGEPEEAAKVFLSYPRFKHNTGASHVAISNQAFQMGNLFFRAGDFDLAKPLYRIAAAQASGSGGEMGAATRLKLLDGNIEDALRGYLERAQRYNDTRAFRDFFGILHALGRSNEAWLGFGNVVQQLHEPHVWETALVGHHMGGVSEAEVLKWSQQREFSDSGASRSYAAMYLARFATTDRIPSKDLAGEIDAIERPTWKFDNGPRLVVRPSLDGRTGEVLGPIRDSRGVLLMGTITQSPKHRVKSDLVYFVEGYRALKSGDFAAAKAQFDEAASLYDMAAAQSSYLLPYYALAAAKIGQTSAVEAIMKRVAVKDQQFDYELADAVLKGVAGKTDEAAQSLKLARYRRVDTEERPPLTEYTYGDICEALALSTGDARIHDIALEWARKSQIFAPWQSWSYALQATLAHDSAERSRALAMAYYLDKNSQHLAVFSKAEIAAATKTYGFANVFVKSKADKTSDKAI
jgi:tetratricopeptide (TPR) repeat protein